MHNIINLHTQRTTYFIFYFSSLLGLTCTLTENFDGDATTDRLDPTWKAQVDYLLNPTRRSTNDCSATWQLSK